jgi:glycosyltransferase involved in cell wall biosynthesis
MTPSISVIIPVYNRFNLLKPVVESILGQTVPVSEIILVDDGSTEHTPEMVEQYIQRKVHVARARSLSPSRESGTKCCH